MRLEGIELNVENFGKILIILAVAIGLIGLILFFAGKGLGIKRIPGDILIERENWRLYLPIVTSVIASVILTIIVNVVIWLMRR